MRSSNSIFFATSTFREPRMVLSYLSRPNNSGKDVQIAHLSVTGCLSEKSNPLCFLQSLPTLFHLRQLFHGWRAVRLVFPSSLRQIEVSSYAGINFIQNHPPPGTNPRDTTRREQKPSPRDNNCVQKPFPRDKTGSQKPHPRDIKLENSDTISNEKLCRLNK